MGCQRSPADDEGPHGGTAFWPLLFHMGLLCSKTLNDAILRELREAERSPVSMNDGPHREAERKEWPLLQLVPTISA